MKKEVFDYIFILIGSVSYALSTVVFIFPHSLLLGETSGLSVILNSYLLVSPGKILVFVNLFLLLVAFAGLLIKTFGIDFVLFLVKNVKSRKKDMFNV